MVNEIVTLTTELLQEITKEKNGPCISFYMPTHRSHPENQKDVILFKNLIKQLKESLQQKYSELEILHIIKSFNSLSLNTSLWNKTQDGLAILSSSDYVKIIYLPIAVKALVIVSERFHVKPLRQYLQSAERYHLLSLNLDSFHLYEGNRFTMVKIELNTKIPNSLSKALGAELTEKHSTVASYGGTGGESSSMHHGDGGRKDQKDNDTEKYFRIISIALDKYYSKPLSLPLILAALPEHHHVFHKVNKNPRLQKEGIMLSARFVQVEKLAEMAWKIMQQNFVLRLKELNVKFEQAAENNVASGSLVEVAKALAEGRVETLFVEQNKIIPGIIKDVNLGTIELGNLKNPETGDLLDAIAEMATNKGAEVIVTSAENMPTNSGLSAIFRY